MYDSTSMMPTVLGSSPLPYASSNSVLGGPAPQAQGAKISPWRVLDSVLGGGKTISQAYDDEKLRPAREAAQMRANQAAAERDAMIRALPPEQRMAAMLDPDAYGKAISSHFQDQVLSEGSGMVRDGRMIVGAPKTVLATDRPMISDPVSHTTTFGAPRGPTFAEQSEDAARRAAAATAAQNAGTEATKVQNDKELGYAGLDLKGKDPDVIVGGILMKQSAGIPITADEESVYKRYLDIKAASNPMNGVRANLLATPPASPAGPAAAAPAPAVAPTAPPPVDPTIRPGKGAGKGGPVEMKGSVYYPKSADDMAHIPIGSSFFNPATNTVIIRRR